MSLDLPDDLVFSPNINYEKKFKNRLFIGSKIGYVNYAGKDGFSNTIPEKRVRIMLDIKPSFALLKYKNSYLKFGAGPSLWYRNDDIVNQIKFNLANQLEIIDYKKKTTKELNLGLNVFTELDIEVAKKFSIVGSIGLVSFKTAGANSMLGVTAFYKFQDIFSLFF
jgi:hypothetical protein